MAQLLLEDPEAIAFGTVKSVADAAGTSAPSVVRLAHALGYDGFGAMRDAARGELSTRLNTDAVRARTARVSDPILDLLAVEHENLDATLRSLDPDAIDAIVDLLDDDDRHIWVLPNTMTSGTAQRFADQLSILRDGVTLLDGSEMRVQSTISALRRHDVVVSMDVPRHELATVRVQHHAVRRGAVPVVLTGAVPAGLSTDGGSVITFASGSVGPFESLIGLAALSTLLVNEIATRRRNEVALRIDGLERAWTTIGLLQP